ncbi:MAG: hypothetical protein M3499_00090 [Actinomycetota bacterium]|nr:hypothetical protein [Actinomycetota bacterium]
MVHQPVRRRRTVAAALTCVCLAAGCGSDTDTQGIQVNSDSGSGQSVQADPELAQALRDLSVEGEPARLVELTDFEWDTVHVFCEGATKESVQRDVGTAVLTSDRYYDAGNLLVFMRDGVVERAVSVVPDLLATRGTNRYSAQVRLTPHGSGTPALLMMREPG